MAFPTVESITSSTFATAGTSHSVNLPATINSGDLLILFWCNRSSPTVTGPSGWTLKYAGDTSGNFGRGETFLRVADGTEGSTVTVSLSGTGREACAQVWRISGWEGTLASVETGTLVTASNSNPNPPSVTASWGAEDNLFIAAIHGADDDATASSGPTNYTNVTNTVSGGGNNSGASVITARRNLNGATDDPGTFTLTQNETHIVQTLVIRPSTSGNVSVTPTTGDLNITGQLPTVKLDEVVTPTTGDLNITGQLATVILNEILTPTTGDVSFTGQLPIVVVSDGNISVTITTGDLNFTGQTPTIKLDEVVTPVTGDLNITGQLPTVVLNEILTPTTGNLTFTGQIPTIITDVSLEFNSTYFINQSKFISLIQVARFKSIRFNKPDLGLILRS